ncbi:MAG: putative transcriptional regulatory protein [Candidatus Parcubacteria bacterium]|nr:MAG: putative transcriptional regulatory protein [Candidatus Parcubacteria bacterium]
MAGHSHWAQIKYKKASNDKKRSQLISKLVNLILTAGRDNPDPINNPKLKAAIERAKEFGVSQEVIERNLKKLKEKNINQLEEFILEAYGPGGVGILIKCLSDNRNRTIGEIKNILQKNKAKLAEPGSVIWLFKEVGVIVINKSDFNEDIIDRNYNLIDDFKEDDDKIIFYLPINNLYNFKYILEDMNIKVLSTEIKFINKNYVNIENKEEVNNLVEKLLDHNDVYEVYY